MQYVQCLLMMHMCMACTMLALSQAPPLLQVGEGLIMFAMKTIAGIYQWLAVQVIVNQDVFARNFHTAEF